MNYVEKTYEEIFDAALQDSLEKGLISHAEDFESYVANQEDISNYYVMDKAAISQMIANIYEDITKVYESAKIEYAEGSDLDDIGAIVGVPRPEETYSQAQVTFLVENPPQEDINIPAGFIVSTRDTNIEYQTVETLYISTAQTFATVQCESLIPGPDSKVGENTLVNIVSQTEFPLSCFNETASSGGNNAYTDDEYRYLLLNWIKIMIKGSLEAYENYFANVDGVDGYKLIPNWDSSGTMKVIVDPGTPYQLHKIYDDLQNEVTQATEDIVMFPPTEKKISIIATVNVDIDQINPYNSIEKQDIHDRIVQATKIFINGGFMSDGEYYPGLLIGEDFIPHKLAVFLDDEIPELKNIQFSLPEDYVLINDEEIGVSDIITIEMI